MEIDEAFLLSQLREVRILASFIAPGDVEDELLLRWPRLWIQDDDGVWREYETGRPRVRQLACLLAFHQDGLQARQVDRYFRRGAKVDPTGRGSKRGAGKTARGFLHDELAAAGIPGLEGLLEFPEKASPASIWRLRRSITDVELARRATQYGAWLMAAALTDNAFGRLVGFPERKRDRPPVFELIGMPGRQELASGILPAELVRHALVAAELTARHFAEGFPENRIPLETILTVISESGSRPTPLLAGGVELDRTDGVAAHTGSDGMPPAREQVIESTATEETPVDEDDAIGLGLELRPSSAVVRDSEPTAVPSASVIEVPVPGHSLVVVRAFPLMGSRSARPRRSRGLGIAVGVLGAAIAIVAAVLVVISLGGGSGHSSAPVAYVVNGTRIEEESPEHPVPTFRDPHELSGDPGQPKIPSATQVRVSCRVHVYVPGGTSIAPYWWYKIANGRWNGRYAPANTFLNGDGGAHYVGPNAQPPKTVHNYDTSVAICGGGRPTGSVEIPLQARIATFANPTNGARSGPPITGGGEQVTVSCGTASNAAVAYPGNIVYLIASAPWRKRYFAPANAFRNAIPADSTHTNYTDFEVPACPPPR
jgi:hypothetical protein